MNLLDDAPVCVLTGQEFLPKEGMSFATQVELFFEGQGGIANSPFGTVMLDKKGIQNSKQHGISRIKSASFAAVKDVLEKGVVILPLDYYGTNDKDEKTGMIAAPIQIADEKYVCVVVVIANTKLQRLYVHESFLTKNLQEVAASNSVRGSKASSPQPHGDVAKVLHNFISGKQNSKNHEEITENKTKTQYKMKKTIRLTEADLRNIIRQCVNEAIDDKEAIDNEELLQGYHSKEYGDAVEDMFTLTKEFVETFENKFKQDSNTLPKKDAEFFEDYINNYGVYEGETTIEILHNLYSWMDNVHDEVFYPNFYN